MAFACQNPWCNTEFSTAVLDEHDAMTAGETPYFTHVYDSPDGVGVVTNYLCSAECVRTYLNVNTDAAPEDA